MRKNLSFLLLGTIVCLILIVVGTKIMSVKQDKHVIILTENSTKGKIIIKSKLRTPYKMTIFLKGTLNDTVLWDGKKIPPSFINRKIYDYDWYADSAWFYYDPYKANKVNLKITYIFYQ